MEKVLKIIEANIRQKPTIQGFADQYHFCLEVLKTDIKLSVRYLKRLNDLCEWAMVNTPWSDVEVRELFELHKKIVLAAAPHDFECYLLYVEWDREPEKKFYLPRRSVLKEVVDAMQDLLDDKLDLLTISMPPGTGKSTLGIFFLSMVMGKYPDNPNLASAHSGLLTRSFFDGALQIITDPEYLWADVFPGVELAGTNTKDDYGNKTGEYEVSYENPVPLKANISAARGETISRQFGEDVSYDRVIVMDDPHCPIDEYSILWIDTVPVIDENGKTATPHDHVVTKVARSINSVSIAISRVSVRG